MGGRPTIVAGKIGLRRMVMAVTRTSAFSVDSAGHLYGGDNQYGRTQKFVPKPGADPKQLIRPPWVAAP